MDSARRFLAEFLVPYPCTEVGCHIGFSNRISSAWPGPLFCSPPLLRSQPRSPVLTTVCASLVPPGVSRNDCRAPVWAAGACVSVSYLCKRLAAHFLRSSRGTSLLLLEPASQVFLAAFCNQLSENLKLGFCLFLPAVPQVALDQQAPGRIRRRLETESLPAFADRLFPFTQTERCDGQPVIVARSPRVSPDGSFEVRAGLVDPVQLQ